MGVVHNPESEYMKEMKKWDTPKRLGGMAPDGFEAFPKMVFKAFRDENGKARCGHPLAATGDAEAMSFTNKCQMTVNNADEYNRAMNAGWSDGPDEALEALEAQQQDIARAVAEGKHGARRMTEKAEREFDAAQAESEDHVPDIPVPAVSPADKKRAKAAADKKRRDDKKLAAK